MVISVVGSGGKTTLIHKLAAEYIGQGFNVFVTTSTHMFAEEDTVLSGDASEILERLKKGYVMAGIPDGKKIKALPYETYKAISEIADVTIVEADGSAHKPVKFPSEDEPVIYDNTDETVIVTGLHAIGHTFKDAAHRLELVTNCLKVSENEKITAKHIQILLRKGYIDKMKRKYPQKKISIHAAHDGSLYQRALAGLIEAEMDVDNIKEEWFETRPVLFICGGGHVAKETAKFAAELDFSVTVMDDRTEFANKERFPGADKIICDSADNLEKYLVPGAFYAVVTRGHKDDYACVEKILNTDYSYLGMIGSKIKVEKTFEKLRDSGTDEDKIMTVHAPIGLDIGAATPGEIAVSIIAEIIREKNKRSVSSASEKLISSDMHGVLCIITEKTGSSPRGVGSMMLVTDEGIIDSIGGGSIEHAVIEDAKKTDTAVIREYQLNNKDSERLGMICGGSNKILFIPV